MTIDEKVSITISIAKSYRDRLRTMAAQQNLHNTDQLTSASTIAREIICEHIDMIECLEAGFKEAVSEAEKQVEPEQDHSSESMTENSERKRAIDVLLQ
jgi:hypothetical protein